MDKTMYVFDKSVNAIAAVVDEDNTSYIVNSIQSYWDNGSRMYRNIVSTISKDGAIVCGKKVTETVKSKNGKEYQKVVKEETTEKRQKDMPSRLNARRKMMKMINKVTDSEGNKIDLTSKLFNEIAPKYEGRVGGYTSIIKAGPRRGDAAEVVILKLV